MGEADNMNNGCDVYSFISLRDKVFCAKQELNKKLYFVILSCLEISCESYVTKMEKSPLTLFKKILIVIGKTLENHIQSQFFQCYC